jgi:hypothetical protein
MSGCGQRPGGALYGKLVGFCFLSRHFACGVGPSVVRPRASAAGPYMFGSGSAAVWNMPRMAQGPAVLPLRQAQGRLFGSRQALGSERFLQFPARSGQDSGRGERFPALFVPKVNFSPRRDLSPAFPTLLPSPHARPLRGQPSPRGEGGERSEPGEGLLEGSERRDNLWLREFKNAGSAPQAIASYPHPVYTFPMAITKVFRS